STPSNSALTSGKTSRRVFWSSVRVRRRKRRGPTFDDSQISRTPSLVPLGHSSPAQLERNSSSGETPSPSPSAVSLGPCPAPAVHATANNVSIHAPKLGARRL